MPVVLLEVTVGDTVDVELLFAFTSAAIAKPKVIAATTATNANPIRKIF